MAEKTSLCASSNSGEREQAVDFSIVSKADQLSALSHGRKGFAVTEMHWRHLFVSLFGGGRRQRRRARLGEREPEEESAATGEMGERVGEDWWFESVSVLRAGPLSQKSK